MPERTDLENGKTSRILKFLKQETEDVTMLISNALISQKAAI
jgi:hypothetical protein